MKSTGDYTGHSERDVAEAVMNALEKAGEQARLEVIELRGSIDPDSKSEYQVTLTGFKE